MEGSDTLRAGRAPYTPRGGGRTLDSTCLEPLHPQHPSSAPPGQPSDNSRIPKSSKMLPLLSVVSFLSVKLMARDAPSGICAGREEHTLMMGASSVPPWSWGDPRSWGTLVQSWFCHKHALNLLCPCPPLCGNGIFNTITRFSNPMGNGQIHI